MNPEKALEDSKPPRIKEEPMSDISFPVSEEPEADLASGDQALPMGVLGAHGERLASGLDGDHSPHASGETRAFRKRLCRVDQCEDAGSSFKLSDHKTALGRSNDLTESLLSTTTNKMKVHQNRNL